MTPDDSFTIARVTIEQAMRLIGALPNAGSAHEAEIQALRPVFDATLKQFEDAGLNWKFSDCRIALPIVLAVPLCVTLGVPPSLRVVEAAQTTLAALLRWHKVKPTRDKYLDLLHVERARLKALYERLEPEGWTVEVDDDDWDA